MIDNEKLNRMVWAEKYRPQNLDDAILPESTKRTVKDALTNGNIPHFLFTGSAGTGKTTLAKIIAKELDADLMFVNASIHGIDVIRQQVVQFASTVSFTGGIKIVLFDEFDGMSPQGQQGLRGVIEEFPNARFIFTCNFKNKVIDAIHSRCFVIDFASTKEETPKLQNAFFKRMVSILKTENVEADKAVVAEVVKKFYPDFRGTLNALQSYAAGGSIDSGILVNQQDVVMGQLITSLKDGNFVDARKWIATNPDLDVDYVLQYIYNKAFTLFKVDFIPELILILSKYQYQSQYVADVQIQLAACMVEIIISGNGKWK